MTFNEKLDLITRKDTDKIKRLLAELEYRVSWLEDREPTSNGITYYNWLDKYDDLNRLVTNGKYIIDKQTIESEIGLAEWITEIKHYQTCYGGLTKLSRYL